MLGKTKDSLSPEESTPTVRHIGENVNDLRLLCCIRAWTANTESTMNFSLYQRVLEDKMSPSVRRLALSWKWTLQHDNDNKHSSTSTKEWLGKKRREKLSSGRPRSDGWYMQGTLHSWKNPAWRSREKFLPLRVKGW